MLIGFAVVADPLIPLVLTNKWFPCVKYMRVIAISLCILPLSTIQAQIPKAMGYSDIIIKQELIKKLTGVFIIWGTVHFDLEIVVYGIAIFEVWCYIINSYPNKNLIGYGYLDQLNDVKVNYVIAATMGLIVYLVGKISMPDIVKLCIQVLTGIIVYIGLMYITKNENLYYLLSIGKNKNEKSND